MDFVKKKKRKKEYMLLADEKSEYPFQRRRISRRGGYDFNSCFLYFSESSEIIVYKKVLDKKYF